MTGLRFARNMGKLTRMAAATRHLRGCALAGAAILATALAGPQPASAQTAAQQAGLVALRKHEDRLAIVGERLSVAAARAGW
ncbi:MAG: hypothetical protein ACKOUM_00320, partial [Sphingopyxis sp.]